MKVSQAFMILTCVSFAGALCWLLLGMFQRKSKVIDVFLFLHLCISGKDNIFAFAYARNSLVLLSSIIIEIFLATFDRIYESYKSLA